ncbi:MAG: hypothetical protein IPK52_15985 [Chloroflexi bacterium]|nr:hypothetical protein [Chloroflexota bacterium]
MAASIVFSQYRIVVNALYMWLSLSLPVLVLIGLEGVTRDQQAGPVGISPARVFQKWSSGGCCSARSGH